MQNYSWLFTEIFFLNRKFGSRRYR